MKNFLSQRVELIKPSATIAVNTKAMELAAAGFDIINLSVGEPDFDTPDFIKQAGIEAIQSGFTKYTAVDGILPLKKAIVQKFIRDNQIEYAIDQIIVSCGVKHGLFNLCQAVLNPGDEVIIPAPYWVSYPDMVLLAEGKPVIVETDITQSYKMSAKQLESAITDKTRMLIINSPSNPSGMAYRADELEALARVLNKHPDILIASDDMYEYILWGMDRYVNILNVDPELADRTIVFNGVSKGQAMTGWRIGYAAGPAPIIRAMKTIQSQSTTNPCSIAQKAAVVAIEGDVKQYQYMFDAYHERHDLVYTELLAMSGVECVPADGTFYLFPKVKQVQERLGLTNDLQLAELLLEKAHIALVPGSAFGTPDHLRISYATDMTTLQKGMQRMAEIFAG